jgi:hypothetical protein
VFPFSVDSASEIFFGKNLATVANTSLGHGIFTGHKTVVTHSDVGLDGGFNIGRESISFEEDIEDFDYGLPISPPSGSDAPIEVDEIAKEINLGGGLTDGYGSVWYGGDSDTANCIQGRCQLGLGLRAYFEFISNTTDASDDSTDHGDGFTFALISGIWDGADYRNGIDDTGGPLGEYLGYAGPGLPAGDQTGLEPPKLALELDTYPNPGAGSICGSNSRVDDVDAVNFPEGANHMALDYWGAEMAAGTTSSFDATGGYLRIGSATPGNGDPEDWSSIQGTISFWFRRDTINYGAGSSGDRMWGQNANMEMRFANSGNDIVLDWGTTSALTGANPFTQADKWYFLAIVWNETNGHLEMYWGDESTPPTLFASRVDWSSAVSSVGISENLFMNSSGGDGSRNFAVDGQGSDLRYYTIAREVGQIQVDYDLRLTGTETDLQAYFPLESDFANAVTSDPSAGPVGSTGWYESAPSVFPSCDASNTRDDNRHGAGGGTTQPMNAMNSDPGLGDDGYYQVAKGFLDTYNWLEDGNCYGVRMELVRPLDASGDGNFDYQIKAWIQSVDADCTGLGSSYKDVYATYTATDPQIALTIDNGNPLELDPTVHAGLRKILFGFTEGTGGATQDITLRNLVVRFIKAYPPGYPDSW